MTTEATSGHEKSATPEQGKPAGQTANENNQATNNTGTNEGGEQELTAAELKAKIAELESSKKRLESESKAAKLKARRLEEQFQKSTETSKKTEETWETKYKSLHDNWMKSSIQGAVQKEAIKRGMINPERALNFISGAGLEFDAETGEVIGAETMFDELQKSDPYLFKTQTPMPSSTTPGGKAPSSTPNYDAWKNLSAAEMKKHLKAQMKK